VEVRERLSADPGLALEFAAFLSRQVRSLRARIELLRIKRAPDRVIAWLRQSAGDGLVVCQSHAWSHAATEIGLTPEALYRALRTLERSGAIRREGKDRILLLPGAARLATA
jgi:CRP-like cAMP-binding protein